MRQWWIGLSRRERIATAAATTLVVLTIVFLAGIEPAWRSRTKLAADLPPRRRN
jgi:type II secretory pathway component PulM